MEALRADGSIFHVELAIAEAETDGRRVFAASLLDLTEQHRRAAALEQSVRENDFYRRMFKAMPDSCCPKDLDGRFIAANEALAQAMGAGSQSGLIGHGRDVTERVKAERVLAASEERFAAFAENACVAIFLKDEEGRYVMLNDEAVKVIGSPRDAIIGRTALEVGTPASADLTEEADRILRATGRPLRTIGTLTAEVEPYHWALVLRFPLAAPTGDGSDGLGLASGRSRSCGVDPRRRCRVRAGCPDRRRGVRLLPSAENSSWMPRPGPASHRPRRDRPTEAARPRDPRG